MWKMNSFAQMLSAGVNNIMKKHSLKGTGLLQ